MEFPDISIVRGTTLGTTAIVVYSDKAKTVRDDLTGSIPVALVKDRKGNLIVDLEPTVELAATYYPDVNDGAGGPLSGYIIVFDLTDEETSVLPDGCYVWDLINEYSSGEKQQLLAGLFNITLSTTLG